MGVPWLVSSPTHHEQTLHALAGGSWPYQAMTKRCERYGMISAERTSIRANHSMQQRRFHQSHGVHNDYIHGSREANVQTSRHRSCHARCL